MCCAIISCQPLNKQVSHTLIIALITPSCPMVIPHLLHSKLTHTSKIVIFRLYRIFHLKGKSILLNHNNAIRANSRLVWAIYALVVRVGKYTNLVLPLNRHRFLIGQKCLIKKSQCGYFNIALKLPYLPYIAFLVLGINLLIRYKNATQGNCKLV